MMNVRKGMVAKRYKVVFCKRCGHMQITYAEKSFQCFRCGELVKLDQNIVLYETSNPSKAREKLINLKADIKRKTNNLEEKM